MDRTIDPEKYYNLSELLDFIPWIKSLSALGRWVETDKAHDNRLKATIMGHGSGKRYLIKGSNIIQYLSDMESEGIQYNNVKGGDSNG